MRGTCTIFALSASISAIAAVRTAVATDLLLAAPAPSGAIDKAGIEFFENNIRTILAEHCFTCHSLGAVKLRGNLLLDSREGVVNGARSCLDYQA